MVVGDEMAGTGNFNPVFGISKPTRTWLLRQELRDKKRFIFQINSENSPSPRKVDTVPRLRRRSSNSSTKVSPRRESRSPSSEEGEEKAVPLRRKSKEALIQPSPKEIAVSSKSGRRLWHKARSLEDSSIQVTAVRHPNCQSWWKLDSVSCPSLNISSPKPSKSPPNIICQNPAPREEPKPIPEHGCAKLSAKQQQSLSTEKTVSPTRSGGDGTHDDIIVIPNSPPDWPQAWFFSWDDLGGAPQRSPIPRFDFKRRPRTRIRIRKCKEMAKVLWSLQEKTFELPCNQSLLVPFAADVVEVFVTAIRSVLSWGREVYLPWTWTVPPPLALLLEKGLLLNQTALRNTVREHMPGFGEKQLELPSLLPTAMATDIKPITTFKFNPEVAEFHMPKQDRSCQTSNTSWRDREPPNLPGWRKKWSKELWGRRSRYDRHEICSTESPGKSLWLSDPLLGINDWDFLFLNFEEPRSFQSMHTLSPWIFDSKWWHQPGFKRCYQRK